jgi:single-stranded-DNA-specific exonuclease
MPSGPEGFVAHPNYRAEFTRAREVLLTHPGRWRIIYHYDGDGIASASSAVRALRRLGYPVQATPFQGVLRGHMEELLHATQGPVWIVDTGASWLDLYAAHPHPVLVLDHHTYPAQVNGGPPELPKHVAFVNPLDWGVDGMSELCAATLTWLYTIFVDPKNWDNAPWGISGAIADRQHVGGFKGLNARLVEEAERKNLIAPGRPLALTGPNVRDALAGSIDPYFRGLSSRSDASAAFLKHLGIEPTRSLSSLSAEELKKLAEALDHALVEQGVRPEFRANFRREAWSVPALHLEADELSNLQNATGRLGLPGVGVALGLGDPQALDRARTAEEGWRSGILKGLRRVEDEGVQRLAAIQWFESSEGTLAGTQAGLAMNYLLDPERPVLVGSHDGTGPMKVSGRGTPYLVDRGLDLAMALREAAAAIGGEGGGHRVASGATVPVERWSDFLARVDAIVAGQLPAVRSSS